MANAEIKLTQFVVGAGEFRCTFRRRNVLLVDIQELKHESMDGVSRPVGEKQLEQDG